MMGPEAVQGLGLSNPQPSEQLLGALALLLEVQAEG